MCSFDSMSVARKIPSKVTRPGSPSEDAQAVHTVFAMLPSVFPHVEAWQTNSNDLLLACAMEPIKFWSTGSRPMRRWASTPYPNFTPQTSEQCERILEQTMLGLRDETWPISWTPLNWHGPSKPLSRMCRGRSRSWNCGCGPMPRAVTGWSRSPNGIYSGSKSTRVPLAKSPRVRSSRNDEFLVHAARQRLRCRRSLVAP